MQLLIGVIARLAVLVRTIVVMQRPDSIVTIIKT